MRKFLSILFLALYTASASAGISSLNMMMPPKDGDPAMTPDPKRLEGMSVVAPLTFFFGGDGVTGATSIVWFRYHKTHPDWVNMSMVLANASYEEARATKEGGKGLPGLGTARLDTPLELINGVWGEICLPDSYDCPDTLRGQWGYGCFCYNLISDSPCTVTIGGAERYYPEPTNVAMNVQATSADRSVTIQAERLDATIYFGIAVNPLHQFVGAQSDVSSGGSGSMNPENGGLIEDEYRMFVFRTAILPNNMIKASMTAWDDLGLVGSGAKESIQEMWHPHDHFEKDSRIYYMIASLGNIREDMVEKFGEKCYNEWKSDEFIEQVVYDDIMEMRRRGIKFPRLDPEFAQITATVKANVETSTTTVDNDEYKLESQTAVTTYNAELAVIQGIDNTHGWTTEDYNLKSSEGTVSNAILMVDHGGTYEITATDPFGNVFKRNVTIPTSYERFQWNITARGYHPGTWSKESSDDVFADIMAAQTDGTVYRYTSGSTIQEYCKWKMKRIPGMPKTCFSSTGNNAKHAISQHVVASAKHWGYWSACDCTYDDGNGNVATVGTPSSMIALTTWAKNNGFSDEEIAAAGIGDLVVGVLTHGEIPDGCLPYFMDTNNFTRAYGGFGVLGWCSTQTELGYGIPCLVRPEYLGSNWLVPRNFPYPSTNISTSNPGGNYTTGSVMPECYHTDKFSTQKIAPTYVGDSGHPIYLVHDGKWILIGNHYSVSGGTSYVKGFKILKAYVESVGDTLNVLTFD